MVSLPTTHLSRYIRHPLRRRLLLLPLLLLLAPGAPVQLPGFTISPARTRDGTLNMPAASCGHPDSDPQGNCTHGVGPGCAAAALNETLNWLTLGGRGIDTAFGYANQKYVGMAVRQSIAQGVVSSRDQIFVTTKVRLGP